MDVELRYGRGTLTVALPEALDATVIRKPPMPVLADPARAVQQALRAPVATAPLAEQARGQKSACILVCDITRPVPNRLLLQPIVRALLEGGVPASGITVLVATGLHRPNLGAELEELIGDPWVLRTVRVLNHDARSDADHVDLGQTSSGTPIKLDRRFVQADLRIVTGLVEPHFMAGYSGGRKVIAPGVAHQDVITTFHSSRFMAHPLADNCVLQGNPLHREQLEIAARVAPVLAANVVIDEQRRLSFVNFGELIESHARAVRFVEPFVRLPVPRRFKTILTSAAGYPLDKTYYQTVKGMVGPLEILEPGGTLIIASECSEGMGSADYVAAQRRLLELGVPGFAESIAPKRHADIDEWQTEMQLKALARGNVQLFAPALSPSDRALTGVRCIDSIEDALIQSALASGDSSIAVVPEGPYVVPVFQPAT